MNDTLKIEEELDGDSLGTEYVEANLTLEQKIKVLETLHELYYSTDQDTITFATEYYYLVIEVLEGKIPTKLVYLCDYEEYLTEAVPELKKYYTKEVKSNG